MIYLANCIEDMKKDKKKQAEKRKIRIKWLPVMAIATLVLGLLAYSNSFTASFHWDDIPHIVHNERVHDAGALFDDLADPDRSIGRKINLRPLSLLSFHLNWLAGGESVAAYHVINLLLHMITAFLVFILFRMTILLSPHNRAFDQRLVGGTAVFIALLFLLHPLQTMAVTYIIQRMTILAALFYVSAIILYALARKEYLLNGNFRKGALLFALAVISGLLGVFSKQNAVTFPAAFILYELFFIRCKDGQMCRKYVYSGIAILLLAFLFVFLGGFLPAETDKFTRMEYFSAQLGILHRYLLLLLLPVSQNADYFIRIDPPLIGGVQIIGISLILALIAGAVFLFRKNRLISFGILFFMLSMSIESGLIPIRDIMMEHRLYLPMLGFGFVLAGGILRYVPYRKRIGFSLAGIFILILLAVATFNRNRVWQSELSLWQDCYDKNPENPRAMSNLGLAIKINAKNAPNSQVYNREMLRAVDLFNRSMEGDTVFVQAYLNRGLTYFDLGEYDRALADIEMVVEKRPENVHLLHYINGVAYAKRGLLKDAASCFDVAVRYNKDFAPLYMWRGLVAKEMEHEQKAIENYRISYELDPGQTYLLQEISDIYYKLRDYQSALYWLRKAAQEGADIPPGNLEILEKAAMEEAGK